MQVLGLLVGSTCHNFCEKSDAQGIDFAKRSISEQAKEKILSSRKELDDINVLNKGQLYGTTIAN